MLPCSGLAPQHCGSPPGLAEHGERPGQMQMPGCTESLGGTRVLAPVLGSPDDAVVPVGLGTTTPESHLGLPELVLLDC